MIGIFDSGSGGLTVLKALRDELPNADVIYFGDIKNMPYGLKSPEELSALTINALTLLKGRGAENIISACNTVSASLTIPLLDAFSITPETLVEMVGPTVSSFKESRARILLAATPATINSGIYQNAFHTIGKDIHTVAISNLASAIECGMPEAEIDTLVAEAFSDVPRNFNVLILACTHYPLAHKSFERALGPMMLFDPAVAVAKRAKERFWPQEVGGGTTHFVLSKDSLGFRSSVLQMFPSNAENIEVLQ